MLLILGMQAFTLDWLGLWTELAFSLRKAPSANTVKEVCGFLFVSKLGKGEHVDGLNSLVGIVGF